ncbi:amidohydrolase [Lacrimispora sp. 210928-DFI.3.58]|uniref:amidohydrolase n=1 Tax=Lacrimispora sp. 210928-DFI.3.58 TaxID=2883214 RepID=UPI0015B59391|nr:amidohydrolase [Lacrimispora sp. 210928-DFI.3.58]MCB7317582.1 amidohydrolase [Lacrimispora sp. 210928-DFI.3.58]
MSVEAIEREIKGHEAELEKLCRTIWENPEPGYREVIACESICSILKKEGFEVETGIGGISTAIRAVWGDGKPAIGFLAEYDSLPGLSQECVPYKKSAGKEYGHGCGHNLMGTACLGAVLGLRSEMIKKGTKGTIVYLGCPAEESMGGKLFLAREGVFHGLDCAISFHPMTVNRVTVGSSLAVNQFRLHFYGKSAHASADPQNGRSALDALELTNVGINYLREHVPSDVRIHYTITDGGKAPNIVPEYAAGLYFVRASSRENVDEVYRRVLKVAQGAALMTETELKADFLGGCYNKLHNKVLCELICECMKDTIQEPWSKEELKFAEEINRTVPGYYKKTVEKYQLSPNDQLHRGVLPLLTEGSMGSSDTGDVSWIVPTATFWTACMPLGTPGHSWQLTASVGSSIGFKGAMFAARSMALWGVRLLENPLILERAKAEFSEVTKNRPYRSPLPEGICPPVGH